MHRFVPRPSLEEGFCDHVNEHSGYITGSTALTSSRHMGFSRSLLLGAIPYIVHVRDKTFVSSASRP
jgi:hypothetical protein